VSVEVRPGGVACNLKCTYCYQNPLRIAGNFVKGPLNLDRIKRRLKEYNTNFTVFGGDALVNPKHVLEDLWKFGYENWKQNGVQTNGALIDDEWIELFKKYNVHVGFSIDGPDELNDARWAGTLEDTREATRKSIENLKKVLDSGVRASLIVTLHKANADTDEKLYRLLNWLKEVHSWGVSSIRLHVLEVDDELSRKLYYLPPERVIEVFDKIKAWAEKNMPELRIDIYRDIQRLMRENDDAHATCIWRVCDPYNTHSVRGIEADGSSSNCGRTNKDGVEWLKAEKETAMRQVALYYTPQEYGGCQGCKYFLYCKGNCPGTGIGGDWRNKSEYCPLWKSLFEKFEREALAKGLSPIVSNTPLREATEKALVYAWSNGELITLAEAVRRARRMLSADNVNLPYQVEVKGHLDHVDDGTMHIDHKDHLDHFDDHDDDGHVDHHDHQDTHFDHYDAPPDEEHVDHQDHLDHFDEAGEEHGDYY